MRNNDASKKNAVSAGTVLPVDSEAMRSRQLPPPPADRSLPKPPAIRDLQNVNPEMNASRQSFRLAMGNACKSDSVILMNVLSFVFIDAKLCLNGTMQFNVAVQYFVLQAQIAELF